MKGAVAIVPTTINVEKFAKKILKNELRIIKKYPPKSIDLKEDFDGMTGLGYNSLTSRSCHYNVLNWWGTGSLRKWMRAVYEKYNNIRKERPLYVQCWSNVMRKGEQIKPHKHEASEGTTPLHHLCGHLCVQVDGSTSTYYEGERILNECGMMTFFPAYMNHWTDMYKNNGERITIAFDILNEDFYNWDIRDEYKNHWVKI